MSDNDVSHEGDSIEPDERVEEASELLNDEGGVFVVLTGEPIDDGIGVRSQFTSDSKEVVSDPKQAHLFLLAEHIAALANRYEVPPSLISAWASMISTEGAQRNDAFSGYSYFDDRSPPSDRAGGGTAHGPRPVVPRKK